METPARVVYAGIDVSKAQLSPIIRSGKTIGVHGISVIQSLLLSGALDELRLIQIPVIVGGERRLLEHGEPPIQLDLQSSRATRTGMNYLVYTPRR